jgi:DNA-binding HxlR family transcriptional regulator
MTWVEQWERLDSETCSVARTLALIGDRWSLLILRDAFNGVRRYAAFRDHLGIPPTVLSSRLARMVDAGIMVRERYQEPGQRGRWEYRLTERGNDLRPVLIALLAYGDKHLSGADGSPLLLTHRGCDAQVGTALVCEHGHRVDSDRELRSAIGPGAHASTRQK